MTPVIAFGVTFAAYGIAALCALLGDALGLGRPSSRLAALALVAGGAVSLSAAWSLPTSVVFGTFVTGVAYSGVIGLAGVLAGVSVLAAASRDNVGAPVGQQSALVALSVVGAGIAAAATDLITLVIALEIAAACGYALVAASRTRRSAEASMKYFVQGAMVTGLLVVGIAVLIGGYAPGGSHLEIAEAVGEGQPVDQAILLGLTLLAASLVFKAGGAPFHSWVPDAYETAPAPAAAVLSGPVKLAMITALSTLMFVVWRRRGEPGGALGRGRDPALPTRGSGRGGFGAGGFAGGAAATELHPDARLCRRGSGGLRAHRRRLAQPQRCRVLRLHVRHRLRRRVSGVQGGDELRA